MRLFTALAIVLLGALTGLIFLPTQNLPPEPLADPTDLEQLIAGLPVYPHNEIHAQFGDQQLTPPPLAPLETADATNVLGDTTAANKRIEVDLTNQRVYAFEGDRKVYDFVVSTGKWYPTPTGEFRIWTKVRSQKMSGGNPAIHTYYYLPNVPNVMFFSGGNISKMAGFSLHGAYWHNNFGHPMSHGCINMKLPDAKVLYDWATPVVTNASAWSTQATAENPGTLVRIYGTTPRE